MSSITAPAATAKPSGSTTYDIAIVGGGIVGLATAYRLSIRHPDKSIVVLEKEPRLAEHQTGHNSGVLHSGIYYKPGSLKAVNCRRGKQMMEEFCREQGIDHELCGKVIVAVGEADLGPLDMIFDRGQKNGVNCHMIPKERLRELEPEAAGIKAIHVPEAGIVNYRQVCDRMGQLLRERGQTIQTGAAVEAIGVEPDKLNIDTRAGRIDARYLVNCGGLHSDRITALTGQKPPVKIVPFRGEYYELRPEARRLCRNLIYPTPDPNFPFLGVHFTRMITRDQHGYHVECGPNAVPAFKREGYNKTSFSLRDTAEVLAYPAFWKMAMTYWRTGMGEMWRSASKAAFVRALQRLLPAVRAEDLEPAAAGVRAQALGRDGKLLDDFSIAEAERVVNVLNAPSPAATSSLSIGDYIVDTLAKRF